MTKLLNLILYAILPAILIFSILYFVEHNRAILLFGIYPTCLFYALGLCAYREKHIQIHRESYNEKIESSFEK